MAIRDNEFYKFSKRFFGIKNNPPILQEIAFNLKNAAATTELTNVGVGFLPKSSYALASSTLLHWLNEVLINKRRRVFECGAGLSTIYLSKIALDHSIDLKIVSVDESEEWLEVVHAHLVRLGCAHFAELIYAPIDRTAEHAWYDEMWLNRRLPDHGEKYDAVLVDGPSSRAKGGLRTRAIPFLLENNFLSDQFAIFVDDIYRLPEYEAFRSWQRLLNCKKRDYKIYGVLSKGDTNMISEPEFQSDSYRLKKLLERKAHEKNGIATT